MKRSHGRMMGWLLPAALIVPVVEWGLAPAADPLPTAVSFNRDIRPILSDTCFHCHGPDKAKRKADLRLDTEEGAKADLGGYFAIVPGKPEQSELIARITARDGSRMPPPHAARQLNERQINLLRRWIEQGARWEKHWAFLPPTRPALPRVQNTRWPRNGIDYFVLERLEREGLTPSPQADRATLVRRVTLDLTGLPPTIDELEQALGDPADDWYEKVVDRLLQSPRYGERMAIRWLEAARYADTNGYQTDGERVMWRWRDWVIEAFNQNLPFDQFTLEQMAGDLLPGATLEQKIATGFHRNHRGNSEGGIIPEEYAVEYVADRVETTATVWLGLTLTCCRCHDHKYDPFTQKEFYQLFAFFNNVPEHGRAIKYGNSPPFIAAPTKEQQAQLAELDRRLADAAQRFARLEPALAEAQAAWEKSLKPDTPIDWTITRELLAHYPLDGDTREASGGRQSARVGPELAGGNTEASGRRPALATLTGEPIRPARFQDGRGEFVPGRLGQAASFDGRRFLDAGNVADFGFYDRFTLAAWIRPHGHLGGTIVSRMTDGQRGADGYRLHLEKGKLQLNLVKRWLDDALHVETEQALEPDRWHHVLVSYDGSRVAAGVRFFVDGKPAQLKVLLDELNQSFDTKEPFRIGAAGGSEGRFHGLIDDVRVWGTVLTPEEVAIVAVTEPITVLAALPPQERTEAQALKLRRYFLEKQAPAPIQQAWRERLALEQQRAALVESFPTCMVMEEMPRPRDTFVLIRGVYDRRGEQVRPGVPAVLSPWPESAPRNRLGLARWLVDPRNPLTARVTVNRFWQMYFGQGIVKTVDDFGVQGDWPSHPELLDWLAVEFMSPSPSEGKAGGGRPSSRRAWDVKALQRLIVTSAAYRQSSKVTAELGQRDPENRLLARGPRLRLPAEMVRDQALFVSGLLVEKLGGPSVKPYQPAGLVQELTGTEDYQPGHGADLYRRSLYTFWKRTVAPPMMMAFDAASRETCVVRETRTNTPLQALNLMNDVTYVEAARNLAERVLKQAGPGVDERLAYAFRLATARRPTAAELQVLRDGLHRHLVRYRLDPEAARKLVAVGESKRDDRIDASELAAYTATAALILNLDEVITKE